MNVQEALTYGLKSAVALSFAIAMLNPLLSHSAGRAAEPVGLGAKVPHAVIQKAKKQGGRVAVIVKLDVSSFDLEARMPIDAVANQQRQIASTQQRVLDSLTKHDLRAVKRFRSPFLAMEVDEAALTALGATPSVLSIMEDRLAAPSLRESTVRIGADDALGMGLTGQGQTLVILDTGVDINHEFFLAGAVVDGACFSTTNDRAQTLCVEGAEGAAAGINCPGDVADCDHGTHVAGIAAGRRVGNRSGVAPEAGIISIQVFSRFTGADCTEIGRPSPCVRSYQSDQVRALEHVFAIRGQRNIAAVNMSLGGSCDGRACGICDYVPQALPISNLREAGIATIVAAGNRGFDDGLDAPACVSTAFSVGNTTDQDVVATSSNTASFLSFLAPGTAIESSIPGGQYREFTGTSMAAPHVAGAWALMRERNNAATVNTIGDLFASTGTAITDPSSSITKPRINVFDALLALPPAEDAPAPSPTPPALWFPAVLQLLME